MRSESKSDRFRRVIEARVNKCSNLLRLIGNCANKNVYEYTPEEAEDVFAYLQEELDRAKERFSRPEGERRRFSLTNAEEGEI